jgi:hypothetical protein
MHSEMNVVRIWLLLIIVRGALCFAAVSVTPAEVHQVWADWAVLTTRLWRGAAWLDQEWTVGPIPVADGQGREIIIRTTTNLTTGRTFCPGTGCSNLGNCLHSHAQPHLTANCACRAMGSCLLQDSCRDLLPAALP